MEYGMPTLIENATLEDNIALCGKLGLRFVELNMNFPEYQLPALEQTERLVELAEEAGVYYTIHLDENLNVADFNPLIADAYSETVKRTIAVARKLIDLKNRFGDAGKPFVVNMHMNHGIFITLPDRKVQMYERDFDVYFALFKKFRDDVEEWIGDSDIVIAIENTDGFRDYEKKVIDYLLESPKFVLTWDIGHSKAVGEVDVSFIRERKNKLKHFHIHDGRENPPKNHLALSDGEIDLKERLAFAAECNARCVLETKTVEALGKSVRWLEKEGLY